LAIEKNVRLLAGSAERRIGQKFLRIEKIVETYVWNSAHKMAESNKSEKIQKNRSDGWDARMDTLAEKVSRAWKGEKNAIGVLSEMRR